MKSVRQRFGMTQAGMATQINVSLRAYQTYEANESQPKAVDLAPLSELGVSLDWLLTGAGQMLRTTDPETAPPLDENLLEVCIEALEDELGRAKRTLPPAKKAAAISALYDLLSGEEEATRQPDRRIVQQFIKLAG